MAENIAKVELEGMKELRESLAEFSKATSRAIVTRALKKAAAPVLEAARSKVPVDKGTLRDSFETTVQRRNAGTAAFAAVKRAGGSTADAAIAARNANREAAGAGQQTIVRVSASASHASLVEFGSVHNAPVGFMRAALDQQGGKARDSIADSMRDEIEKAAKRAAARAKRKG